MAARNAANCIGHSQDGEAKGQRDADEAYSKFRKRRRQHGAAATAEHEPERSQKFR
jgi:hypothetical protein